MKRLVKNKTIIYQAKTGAIRLRGDYDRETIWATQAKIASIFDIDRTVVTKHIKNILRAKEIDEKRNVQKMHIANSDKSVSFYSLDMILTIGYRTNSSKAIAFRQWATKVLHEHITKGYTINKSLVVKNYNNFLKSVEDIKSLLPSSGVIKAESTLELVKLFASTWFSLDAYDKNAFPISGATKNIVRFSAKELNESIAELKIKVGSNIFGVERNKGSIDGIVGNVFQSFGDQDVYPTVEEKAAHLLYFMVKNHPFIDGNKRSGAFAFVWFLRKAKILDLSKITPEALTALTLFVAESESKNKDKMVGVVLQLLKK